MSVYVVLQVYLKPGEEERFEQTYRSISAHLQGRIHGQLSDELLRPVNPEDPYILLSRWQSLDAYNAWLETPQHRSELAPLRQHWERTVAHQYLLVNKVDPTEEVHTHEVRY